MKPNTLCGLKAIMKISRQILFVLLIIFAVDSFVFMQQMKPVAQDNLPPKNTSIKIENKNPPPRNNNSGSNSNRGSQNGNKKPE
jgi:hypothetical protein